MKNLFVIITLLFYGLVFVLVIHGNYENYILKKAKNNQLQVEKIGRYKLKAGELNIYKIDNDTLYCIEWYNGNVEILKQLKK